MNRRQAFQTIAAGTLAGSISAIAFAVDATLTDACGPTNDAISPELAKALSTHRRAFDAGEEAHEAFDRCCVAHAADLEINPIRYVASVGPMHLGAEGHRCPDFLRRVTPAVYQDARRMRVRKAFGAAVSNPLDEGEALYQADLTAMAEAEREEDRRWTAANGPSLEQADDDAAAEERLAWAAFIAAPAVTPADVTVKVEYVLASRRLIFRATGDQGNDGVALLKSLVGGRA